MKAPHPLNRIIGVLFWAFVILAALAIALLAQSVFAEEIAQPAEPYVIEIVKRGSDIDTIALALNRRQAEHVVDILIASGNYAGLPDIIELREGRCEIKARRRTND